MDHAREVVENALDSCLERNITDWGKIKNCSKGCTERIPVETHEEKSYDPADHYGGIRSNSNGRKYNRRKHQPSDRIH